MLIGYARVSTQDQTLRLQHDALTDGGCEKLFREKLSGTRTTLPAREKLLAFARKGDVVVVWKLDRFGRSLRDLIDVVNSLQDRGVGLLVSTARRSIGTSTLVRNAPLSVQNRTDLPDTLTRNTFLLTPGDIFDTILYEEQRYPVDFVDQVGT